MKFKLDENFGTRTLEIFRAGKHDAQTVAGEGLSGCADMPLERERHRASQMVSLGG